MSEVERLTQQQIDERIANIASFAAVNHRGYENAAMAHVKFLLEVLATPPAVWSRERPTVEGHYWFKVPHSEPELYKVFEVGGGQLAIENSGEIFWLEKFDGFWAGPLRPPVEGKG